LDKKILKGREGGKEEGRKEGEGAGWMECTPSSKDGSNHRKYYANISIQGAGFC
jgi:hypothetical protein